MRIYIHMSEIHRIIPRYHGRIVKPSDAFLNLSLCPLDREVRRPCLARASSCRHANAKGDARKRQQKQQRGYSQCLILIYHAFLDLSASKGIKTGLAGPLSLYALSNQGANALKHQESSASSKQKDQRDHWQAKATKKQDPCPVSHQKKKEPKNQAGFPPLFARRCLPFWPDCLHQLHWLFSTVLDAQGQHCNALHKDESCHGPQHGREGQGYLMPDDSKPDHLGCRQADSFCKKQGYRKTGQDRDQAVPQRLSHKHGKQPAAAHPQHQVKAKFFPAPIHLIAVREVDQEEYEEQRYCIYDRNQQHQPLYRIAFQRLEEANDILALK